MRAVCCGYYGMGNAGDEALLASLLQMLPPEVTPVVLSGNPEETSDRYGVAAVERMSAPQIVTVFRQSDVFIWGGGSLIQDATSFRSPLYYEGLMGLARSMGLKTIAWAQGIGPLQGSLTRKLARQAFATCSAVSVRDARSAALLADWQIPFVMAPDPVWAMDSKPMSVVWDLPAPRVAVALRSHPLLTAARLANLSRALVDFQEATNTCILLVPFQASKDLAIAQEIQPQLTGPSQIFSLEDPQELKGLFREVEMTIGMRYHSLIMAAAEGCRCFALSYDPKVSQLMAEFNLPGWELSALPEDADAIAKSWIDFYAKGEALSGEIISSTVELSLLHRELLWETILGCGV
ncbi:MAG: polysaccharide pyruvyl transferase CsaB [Oscillatoria sp. SIO1A7]|nr:polysaccharide pyruvyl transferase CsaB [Oscillatoria sp. SIO1A7]